MKNNLKTLSDILSEIANGDSLTEGYDTSMKLNTEQFRTVEKMMESLYKKLKSNQAFLDAVDELCEICKDSLKERTDFPYEAREEDFQLKTDTAYGYKSKYITLYHYRDEDADFPDVKIQIKCGIERPLDDYTTLIEISNDFEAENYYYCQSEKPKIKKAIQKVMDVMVKVLEQELKKLKKVHLDYEKYNGRGYSYKKYYITQGI